MKASDDKENTPFGTGDASNKSGSPSINSAQLRSFLELESQRESRLKQHKAPSTARPPIFVYGYLTDHLLLSLLLFGRLRDQKELKTAKVMGYDLRIVERSRFPVLVSSSSPSAVEGFLLYDLSAQERNRIKNFHPRLQNSDTGAHMPLLCKTNMTVQLEDGEEVEAISFLWNDRLNDVHQLTLSEGSWDSKAARKMSLKAYAAVFWGNNDNMAIANGIKRQQSLPSFSRS